MPNYSKAIVMGHLTRDPEVRFSQSGTTFCTFSLAVNRKRKDAEDQVSFIDCKMIGKRGEAFAEYHKKGDAAFVEGELEQERWESPEGERRSKLVVVAWEWQFVGSKNEGGKGGRSANARRGSSDQEAFEYESSVDDTPF